MKTAHITKRIFSILLTLCMLVSVIGLIPLTAFATEGEAKITPSADSGQYDSLSNTLVVVGGGEVNFTASEGITFDSVEGVRQPYDGTEEEPTPVAATFGGEKWVATLPNENAEYIFFGYYQVEVSGGVSTEAVTCTVIVIQDTPLVYTNAEEAVNVEFSAQHHSTSELLRTL